MSDDNAKIPYLVPITLNPSTDPKDIIHTTQSIRLLIAQQRMGNGFNADAKELALDLQLLRDLDGAALTTRKLDTEDRAVDEAGLITGNVKAVLRLLQGKNPAEVSDGSRRRETPLTLDDVDLPQVSLVHNHTLQGVEELDYADFVDTKSKA